MSLNPFIALYDDPVLVLGSLAYALALFAAAIGTVGATVQLVYRGWTHLLWLSNAWEWRSNAQQYGPEWEWYLPPKEVANRLTVLIALVALVCLLAAVVAALLSAFVYVLA